MESEELNNFAASIDMTPDCAEALRALDQAARLRCLTILQQKMKNRTISSPGHYLFGIIRNESSPGGFSGSAWGHANPVQHGPALLPLSAISRIPTPQNSLRGVKRPAWVSEAWPLATKPSALLKKMHSVLGAEAMASISNYPAQIQLSLVLALVFCEGAWADPAAALASAVTTLGTMPPLQTAVPSRVVRKGRALVVLQMGPAFGAEWVHLQGAVDELKREWPDLYVHGAHAYLGSSVAEELHSAMKPDVALHKDVAAFADMVGKSHGEWRSLEATVLLLITASAPSSSVGGALQYPGNHCGDSKAIWGYLKVLKALLPITDNRLAFVCTDPVAGHAGSADLLDKMFGRAFEIASHKTKVPVHPWHFRSFPVAAESDLSTRRVQCTPADELFATEIQELRRGSGQGLVFPTIQELEDYSDAVSFGDSRDSAAENVYKLLQVACPSSSAPAGARRLLSRAELARVWGIDGWNIDEARQRLQPCCKRCDALTGFPVAAGGVACGDARWCMHCEGWYKLLVETPPPHAFSLILPVLRASLQMKAPGGTSPGWSDLNMHVCSDSGCA